MEPTYILNLETEPKASDINAITLGLMAYNDLHATSTPKYVIITLRDGEQKIVGGLVGLAYLDWLHVQALWLQEELRGHGYGSSMLAKAEAEAVRLDHLPHSADVDLRKVVRACRDHTGGRRGEPRQVPMKLDKIAPLVDRTWAVR